MLFAIALNHDAIGNLLSPRRLAGKG